MPGRHSIKWGHKMKWKIPEETKGNLPYIVMWISLNGLVSTTHHKTIIQADEQYNHLKGLGREPTLLAILTPQH